MGTKVPDSGLAEPAIGPAEGRIHWCAGKDSVYGACDMTPDGLMTRASRHEPKETMDRLVKAVTDRGMAVLARIDHAGAAAGVGLTLRPTEVLIFGNPRGGTPLMQAAQTMGIDLPLKALVWQDEAGRTWLSYNDPHWLARRHGASAGAAAALDAMADALAGIAGEATA